MTMKKNTINNARLGIFVVAGSLILVVSLYLIGQNQNFFGSNFLLKARFRNVSGLMPGNNVRFAGIQCGTVKDIEILNDTTIEVRMLVNDKTSRYIRSNASASIGTEGLMGNKVINISPGSTYTAPMPDGGTLHTSSENAYDDLLASISATGDNANALSADLKETAKKINNSPVINQLLEDKSITDDLRQSLKNFRDATGDIKKAAADAKMTMAKIQAGHGVAGVLLSDEQAALHAKQALSHLVDAAERANGFMAGLDSLAIMVRSDMEQGNGTAYMLLRDTTLAGRVQNSLLHIEQGTKAFSEDMEALKHNFLLRGYFRKQERKKNR